MEPVVVIALVVALVVAMVILIVRHRPHQDDGMHNFRRHIDALSPESRREVMDRARRHDQTGHVGHKGPVGPEGSSGSQTSTGDAGRNDQRGPDAAAAGGAADGNS